MKIKGMKEEFFNWLNNCPVEWVLNRDDKESIEYVFYKEEDESNESFDEKDEESEGIHLDNP